jgi:hypothetical protein
MKIKKISAIFSVVIIAALLTVYYTSVGYTNVQSNSAIAILSDSTTINPVYTCPMHPEVTSDKPGQCPKCGMDLVLKSDDNGNMNMTMKECMDKCKEMGCDMNNCKGEPGSCKEGCKMMKDGMNKDTKMDCKDKDMMKDGKCKSNCNGK